MAGVAVGLIARPTVAAPAMLSTDDVTRIIGQAITEANDIGLPVNISVVDREGNILGTKKMDGAVTFTRLVGNPSFDLPPGSPAQGAEGLCVPATPDVPETFPAVNPFDPAKCPPASSINGALLAAISKAGTAAFFSTQGNAFSTRTAGFIIQPHFPPLITNTSSGPLFGVQVSQLFCGNVIPRGLTYPPPLPPLPLGTLPLGLSGDPGGLPLYKNGRAVGGIGVEGNGRYSVDLDPTNTEVTKEERIAAAGTHGFEAPAFIRGDRIIVGGLRFPFSNVKTVPAVAAAPVTFDPTFDVAPNTGMTRFVPETIGGVEGTVDPRYFPPRDSLDPSPADGGLVADEVLRRLIQAARQADRTRAGIRRPLGDRARVNITVVDTAGNILGIFRTKDAPTFGFDVSAQKARTAAFFSKATARQRLLDAGQGDFVTAAAADGIPLDGSVAFSDRAHGFVSRPFFPDGIDGTRHGPFSRSITTFSVFNDGLQVELLGKALVRLVTKGEILPCTEIDELGNGIQIFPGSVPIYRGRTLIGAVGISGDGVDQDDIVAFAGARGVQAPPAIRADRLRVRGVRLPYVKFPRRPTTR
jgi:uncharacterized protein GlcG (DUF336 family)